MSPKAWPPSLLSLQHQVCPGTLTDTQLTVGFSEEATEQEWPESLQVINDWLGRERGSQRHLGQSLFWGRGGIPDTPLLGPADTGAPFPHGSQSILPRH